jgi:NADH-quinone oxidoreductase subunit D
MRVIVAELQRIASHLLGVGTFGLDLGAFTPFPLLLYRKRKNPGIFLKKPPVRALLYNYMAVGGLMRDIPDDFQARYGRICSDIPSQNHRN